MLFRSINLDFDGLGRTVAGLIGGVETKVDTKGFANDLATFRDRDDVLTLLIHLGYLAYDERTGKARVPNEEIRLEFAKAIRQVRRDDTIRRVQESQRLIEDTVHGREEAKKDSMLPALIIELKWNKSAEGAIGQIKGRQYPNAVKGYGGDILLVGINYDKEAPAGKKKHQCKIEKYEKAR